MNSRAILLFLAGLAAGGGGGFLLGRSGERPAEAAGSGRPKAGGETKGMPPPVLVPGDVRTLMGDGPLTAENAAARISHALTEADPLRRQTAIALLLLSMDAGNAWEIIKGFEDVSKTTGRTADTEWAQMLRRFGQVVGADGVRELAKKTGPRHALEGLASVDPDAARALLSELDPNNPDMRSAYMSGLALKDPGRAFRLILAGEEMQALGPQAMKQAIQALGLDGAGDALNAAMGSGEHDPETLARFQGLFDTLTDSMFYKHWLAGTPEKMIGWLEKQKGGPQITGAVLGHAAKDAILSGNHTEALNFLDRMNEGRTGEYIGGDELAQFYAANPDQLLNADEATWQQAFRIIPRRGWGLHQLDRAVRESNSPRAAAIRDAEFRSTGFVRPGSTP